MGSSRGDYQQSNDDGASPVYQILVYNFWEYLTAAPPLEPNFERGLPADAPIDPLVWGALYAESRKGLKSLGLIRWTSTFAFLGIIFAGNLLPQNPFVDDFTLFMIGGCFFVLALVLPLFCAQNLKWDMRSAVDRVNEILGRAGYTVRYDITNKGVCYSAEHRFQIYHFPKELTVLDAIPRTLQAMPPEPVKVYIHAPWYRQFFLWKCGCRHHDFFQGKQPTTLNAIHPYIWGSLCDAFHSHEIDELRAKRTGAISTLIALAIFSFFAIRDSRPWWIPVSVLLLLAVGAFFFFEHLLVKTTRKIGHDKWVEQVRNWRGIMEPMGWHLEYHHKDESDDAMRTKLCGGYPSDFVRFVPIHV